MTDRLSPAGEPRRVFGLIASDWGGTRVEAWMGPDALDACNTPPNDGADQNSNQVLWNAMVHPFLRHNIYGGLWYQGKEFSRRTPYLGCMILSAASVSSLNLK